MQKSSSMDFELHRRSWDSSLGSTFNKTNASSSPLLRPDSTLDLGSNAMSDAPWTSSSRAGILDRGRESPLRWVDSPTRNPSGHTTKGTSSSRISTQLERCIFPLPPTTNRLPSDVKQQFVRKNKKLQSVLGATLDEIQAGQVLLSASKGRSPIRGSETSTKNVLSDLTRRNCLIILDSEDAASRRRSIPLLPSESLDERESNVMIRPIDVDKREQTFGQDLSGQGAQTHETSSAPSSLIFRTDMEINAIFPNSACSSVFEASPTVDELSQKEREERRRKLAKVQRWLGEKVPVDLVTGAALLSPESPSQPTISGPETIGAYGMSGVFASFGAVRDMQRRVSQKQKRNGWKTSRGHQAAASLPVASANRPEVLRSTESGRNGASPTANRRAKKLEQVSPKTL